MKRNNESIAWGLGLTLLVCAMLFSAGCCTSLLEQVEPVLVRTKALADTHAIELERSGEVWVEGYTLTPVDVETYQGYCRDARTVYSVLQELHDGFKEK